MIQGQITRGHEFGAMLYDMAKSNGINTIVEIGTWNGMGSTKCIVDGIIDSEVLKNFISLEIWPEMYEQAKVNLAKESAYVQLIYGSILLPEEMMPFQKTVFDQLPEWHKRDKEYITKAPNVLHMIPSAIDLLVLDGGDFTTYPEWKKLKSRTRIVALDDTMFIKTNRIRDELLDDSSYKTVRDNQRERNGYSIFEIKPTE